MVKGESFRHGTKDMTVGVEKDVHCTFNEEYVEDNVLVLMGYRWFGSNHDIVNTHEYM